MKTRHNKIFIALRSALIIPVGLLMVSPDAFAVNRTSVANGNWGTAATWSPAAVPGAADNLTINTTVANASGVRSALSVTTNSGSGTLNISGSGSVTVGTSGAGTTSNNGTLSLAGATLSSNINTSGSLTQTGGTLNAENFTQSDGTSTISGGTQNIVNLSVQGGTLNYSSAADLYVTNVDVNGVTPGGGTLNLTGGNVYVSSTYSNAGFGTGNDFNATAGVTGTSVIRAASDGQDTADGALRQSISGGVAIEAGQTSGTLTFANKHVGDTAETFNYKIENIYSSDTPTVATVAGPDLVVAKQYAGTGLTGTGATAENLDVAWSLDSGDQAVTRSTASAGTVNGQTIVVKSNLGDEQTINISGGSVYAYAQGVTPGSVTVADQHVGGTNTASISVKNNGPAGAFTENLNAVASGSGSGSIASLAAQATDSTSIQGSVNTASAGAKSETATVTLKSLAGATGLSDTALGSNNVTVNGNVYALASTTGVDDAGNLGGFHVGDTATKNIDVSNTATNVVGFTETVSATVTKNNGDATGTSASNIVAGSTGTVSVTIDTSTVGNKSGSVDYKLESIHVAGSTVGDTNLGTSNSTASATVYEYAEAALKLNTTDPTNPSTAGVSLTPDGTAATSYTLNLGSQLVGAGGGILKGAFNLLNLGNASFSDIIEHATWSNLTTTGTIGLSFANFSAVDFGNIVGGGQSILQWVSAASTAVGTIAGSATLTWNGFNANINNYTGPNQTITLNFTGDVRHIYITSHIYYITYLLYQISITLHFG